MDFICANSIFRTRPQYARGGRRAVLLSNDALDDGGFPKSFPAARGRTGDTRARPGSS